MPKSRAAAETAAKAKSPKSAANAVRTPPDCRPAALLHGEIFSTVDNPRTLFEAEKLGELAESIAARGLIQPIAVCQVSGTGHIIVEGERRWRAIGQLIARGAWPADRPIPCMVRPDAGDLALVDSLIANIQRVDLTPLEEAEALRKLQDLDPDTYATGKLAALLGKDPRHIQLRLALVAKLAPEVQAALAKGEIELAHARELTTVPRAVQTEMIDRLVATLETDRVTADELRADLHDERMDARHALFDLAPHGARLIDGAKKGERWFVGRAAFLALQKTAAIARVKTLRKAWSWAEVSTGQFQTWNYAATGSKDKSKSGVVIHIDQFSGKATIHEGLVKKKPAAQGRGFVNGNSEAARAAREQRDAVCAQLRQDLRARIAAADPLLGLRLLAFLLMAPHGSNLLEFDPYPGNQRFFAEPEPCAPWRERFGDLVGKTGAWTSDAAPAAIWTALGDLAKTDLPKLLASLTAHHLDIATYGESTDAFLPVAAAAFGVTVPPALLPKGATAKAKPEAQAKPRGKGKTAAPLTVTPADAQMMETRRFSAEETLRFALAVDDDAAHKGTERGEA